MNRLMLVVLFMCIGWYAQIYAIKTHTKEEVNLLLRAAQKTTHHPLTVLNSPAVYQILADNNKKNLRPPLILITPKRGDYFFESLTRNQYLSYVIMSVDQLTDPEQASDAMFRTIILWQNGRLYRAMQRYCNYLSGTISATVAGGSMLLMGKGHPSVQTLGGALLLIGVSATKIFVNRLDDLHRELNKRAAHLADSVRFRR